MYLINYKYNNTERKRCFISYDYIKLKLPDGTLIDEHRYIIQEHLGRKLERWEVVHHKDENKRNNDLDNLELKLLSDHSREHMIGRQLSDKTKEKLKHTRKLKGSEQTNAKLNEEMVRYIKCLLNSGYGCRELGELFEVHHSRISAIKTGKNWTHVVLDE